MKSLNCHSPSKIKWPLPKRNVFLSCKKNVSIVVTFMHLAIHSNERNAALIGRTEERKQEEAIREEPKEI